MKRLTLPLSVVMIIILTSALLPLAAHAQTGNDLIVLNDSTPGIDVVINPSPNTTGVIALEIKNASVTVTDAVGNVVFEAADLSIAGVEFSFAPNAGTHTLTVERLPGAVQAYARIAALPEMTSFNVAPQLVDTSTLAADQEADFPLNVNSPSSVIDFAVAGADYATVTSHFPGAPVTAQLVDVQKNRTLATLTGSLIDGVRFTVAEGTYELLLLNNNTARNTVATVSVTHAPQNDFETLVAQAEANGTTMITTGATANAVSTCMITIGASLVNLRSGPGTGYSVLDDAFRGDLLTVGGVNTQSGWMLVGDGQSSGWISSDLGVLNGDCTNLTVYDVPYREAVAPQVTIQQPQVPVYHEDDDQGEHEGQDDGHNENEYDD